MKKIFTLVAVVAMAISANAQTPGAENGDLWLAAAEYTEGTADVTDFDGNAITANTWTFNNGVKLSLLNPAKGYSGGNSNKAYGKPIKLSNGAYNMVDLPEGFSCSKIIFYGYCNSNGATSAFEVFDTEKTSVYKGADNVEGEFLPYVAKGDFSPMTLEDMPKVEATLSKAVSGTFYFKNSGKQPCVFIQLVKDKSGTSAVNTIATDENATVEYFNLQGVKVSEPANGLYIKRQGSKVSKVVVK